MKTKILSVIAAASLAMTAFASLTITASAATYSAGGLHIDATLKSGDVIDSGNGDVVLYIFINDNQVDRNVSSYRLSNTYSKYVVYAVEYFPSPMPEVNPSCYEVWLTGVTEPVTATFKQVGKDYPAAYSGDNAASLWKVTVTPGEAAVETGSAGTLQVDLW